MKPVITRRVDVLSQLFAGWVLCFDSQHGAHYWVEHPESGDRIRVWNNAGAAVIKGATAWGVVSLLLAADSHVKKWRWLDGKKGAGETAPAVSP